MKETIDITDLSDLQRFAKRFAGMVQAGDLVFLRGDLGAGKTTFTQMLLKAAGVTDPVKSPTYTLYETYVTTDLAFVHMDLYRLSDPEELYFLGLEDLVDGRHILLVEWPDKGRGVLQPPDWVLELTMTGANRTLTLTSK
ncbi:tRNA (adenosine(37)-N6)-threonylcarbamoyltransferase complex ATPase subunit type 1 TsaE [Marinicella meishanensis]|uniref:tRNA (adenosine(37)-N6)-threonylcarbamoyltransferase complex ATPase subunit type 1 TsaE n=1 Tax=Marinicella meishanensis TaxID=2873263 RepID=UPI001CBB701D|nr:tRNA (adenosine(37)-N6)-threonylcarbamoyltransferase complex ATPase subunit type 1 TsaE [Marinicella sp. NBU2979]